MLREWGMLTLGAYRFVGRWRDVDQFTKSQCLEMESLSNTISVWYSFGKPIPLTQFQYQHPNGPLDNTTCTITWFIYQEKAKKTLPIFHIKPEKLLENIRVKKTAMGRGWCTFVCPCNHLTGDSSVMKSSSNPGRSSRARDE
jgi:hypothetical protein